MRGPGGSAAVGGDQEAVAAAAVGAPSLLTEALAATLAATAPARVAGGGAASMAAGSWTPGGAALPHAAPATASAHIDRVSQARRTSAPILTVVAARRVVLRA